MSLLDLSLVTRSLVRLVTESINVSPAKPMQLVTVTSIQPSLLEGENTVGIYLYHASEQPQFKNRVWPGRPGDPIKFSPLALDLHYVVCTRSELGHAEGPYREQLLMGLAMKAFHDLPIVDDTTQIGGTTILEPGLIGGENRLRISLRNISASEAVTYWTAGKEPLRLSAYYEVSVVMLDPEEPSHGNGRVLSYGVDVLPGGLPRLSTSRNTVRFTIPGEPNAREVEVQPAQVALGDELVLVGGGLDGAIDLRVRAFHWPAARPLGASWGVHGSADRLFATIQADVDGEPTLPGAYTASVAITRNGVRSDGSAFATTHVSNETPFLVAPSVALGPVSPVGEFTVTGGLFADPRTPPIPTLVRVSIGGVVLDTKTLPLDPGTFHVVSPTELRVRLPTGYAPGKPLGVRVEVQGSESAPRWVVPT